jgi:hypothetical protein
MHHRLTCLICGLSEDAVPEARTGDPQNKLVAMQEHVVQEHHTAIGLDRLLHDISWEDPSDLLHKAWSVLPSVTERREVREGCTEWAINDVLWLRAETTA